MPCDHFDIGRERAVREMEREHAATEARDQKLQRLYNKVFAAAVAAEKEDGLHIDECIGAALSAVNDLCKGVHGTGVDGWLMNARFWKLFGGGR